MIDAATTLLDIHINIDTGDDGNARWPLCIKFERIFHFRDAIVLWHAGKCEHIFAYICKLAPSNECWLMLLVDMAAECQPPTSDRNMISKYASNSDSNKCLSSNAYGCDSFGDGMRWRSLCVGELFNTSLYRRVRCVLECSQSISTCEILKWL